MLCSFDTCPHNTGTKYIRVVIVASTSRVESRVDIVILERSFSESHWSLKYNFKASHCSIILATTEDIDNYLASDGSSILCSLRLRKT